MICPVISTIYILMAKVLAHFPLVGTYSVRGVIQAACLVREYPSGADPSPSL